jgi:transposase
MSAETLRMWVCRAGIDAEQVPGVTSESAREIRELKRKIAPRTYYA